MAMALAQREGVARPSVYGFGACAPCNKYYECDGHNSAEQLGQNGWHAFAEEAVVRRAWNRSGWIRLVEPPCTHSRTSSSAVASRAKNGL